MILCNIFKCALWLAFDNENRQVVRLALVLTLVYSQVDFISPPSVLQRVVSKDFLIFSGAATIIINFYSF